MKERENFWLKKLRWGWLFIFVTGLIPFFAIFVNTQEPWRLYFDILTWPVDNLPNTFTDSERQLSAILGGVLCGWSWIMYKLANEDIFNSKIRRLMYQSTWGWFLLDSSGSILSGLPLNAIGNLVFLLLIIVPLSALKTVK
jgi:hypothetical protein